MFYPRPLLSDIFFVFWPGPILQVSPARSAFGKNIFERLFILLEYMRPKEIHQRAPVGGGILLVQGRNDASQATGDICSGFKVFLLFALQCRADGVEHDAPRLLSGQKDFFVFVCDMNLTQTLHSVLDGLPQEVRLHGGHDAYPVKSAISQAAREEIPEAQHGGVHTKRAAQPFDVENQGQK